MNKLPEIDQKKCLSCGACWQNCFSGTVVEGKQLKPQLDENQACILCGHCEAACPAEAITLNSLQDFNFSNFTLNESYLTPLAKLISTADLARLMASRRSIRTFKSIKPEKEILEDLVRLAVLAPSSLNTQALSYNIISNSDQISDILEKIIVFYKRILKLSNIFILREITYLFGINVLKDFHKRFRPLITKIIKAYEEEQKDLIFHQAPSLIVINSLPNNSSPLFDAGLAAQNLLLAAHTMGLGSCLIGLAVKAAQKDKIVSKALLSEKDETVQMVISLGYPAEDFSRVARKKEIKIKS